jgi:uncharacterized membrane protein YdjX (TVP38/TMEM64 family)
MTLRAVLPRLLLGLAILAGTLCLGLNRLQLDAAVIEGAVRNLGLWGPVVHVALFALGTVLFVPGVLFGLAGGVLFGPVWGTIFNLVGATVGPQWRSWSLVLSRRSGSCEMQAVGSNS